MGYITVKDAAAKWNIAERSVQNYCASEKMPGVRRIGGQWFIPDDAVLPFDRRTKMGKNCNPVENYKFPVFIYTHFYKNPSELTQEEQKLLQAQILHFEGKHMQSLIICNSLLEDNPPSYLKAGIYLIIGICSFILGLISKYEEAVFNLERLTLMESTHKEDFLLMTTALKFYIDWNTSNILMIQPSKLSYEAIWYYKSLIFTISATSGITLPIQYVRYIETELPLFEKEGLTPLLYFFLCGLGVLKNSDRTNEEREILLSLGVEIAIERKWVHNLHRFYSFAPESMDKIVKSHGVSYYRELQQSVKESLNNWNIIHKKMTGHDFTNTFTPKQMELLLLISYGYTDKDIALCLGLSEIEIKSKVKCLKEISVTTTKAQLRAYAREIFNPSN